MTSLRLVAWQTLPQIYISKSRNGFNVKEDSLIKETFPEILYD